MASIIGISHLDAGEPCQDALRSFILKTEINEEVFVAVVSDGAGSAKYAQDGASLTCALFVDEIQSLFESGGKLGDITRDFAQDWILRLHRELSERAIAKSGSLRDFACTFLAAVVGQNNAVFLQIGDGAIIIDEPGEDAYICVFWPQGGEYAGTTNFITDTASAMVLEHKTIERRLLSLAVLTDGIQPLALRLNDKKPHIPFFKPIFGTIVNAAPGYNEQLSQRLADFLNSDRVNERTHDDKTLIFAVRGQDTPPTTLLSNLPEDGCGITN